MARLIELEPGLFVAPQVVVEDLQEVAGKGFRSVVNNRPDGEAADQLLNETAAATAHKLGLRYLYQPVPGLNVADDEVVDAFRHAMESLPRPLLFYCRSGTRCTILWAQASAARLGVESVLATAKAAGYDLGHVREFIEAQAERGSTWGAF
jgi:sulfide:quinone oxidoreductase